MSEKEYFVIEIVRDVLSVTVRVVSCLYKDKADAMRKYEDLCRSRDASTDFQICETIYG